MREGWPAQPWPRGAGRMPWRVVGDEGVWVWVAWTKAKLQKLLVAC